MVDTLQNLKSVYEKWEGRKPGRPSPCSSTDQPFDRSHRRNKYGDTVKAPPVRRPTNKRSHTKPVSNDSILAESIASFKTTPIFSSEDFRLNRPFMGQCCSCLPTSRRSLMTGSCTQMGLRNVLDVKHELRNRGPLAQSFCHLAYLLHRRTFYPYTDVSLAVLKCARVLEAVHQKSHPIGRAAIGQKDVHLNADQTKLRIRREEKSKSILNGMKANFSSVLVSLTGWFLLKFLSLMTSSIQVHKGQMQLVKKATEKNVPMIYVPLHRSHLDYILVTFILWHYDIKSPHIAAGDNLNMPVFSSLMRGLGAFFIRRRLDKQRGKKDILYRSILQSYVEELLRNGEGIEFFIEGGRTRTGKACNPKSGLLSVIVDAYRSDVIEDAYIVPVTINYEKLLDGNFNNELMGKKKPKETFWAAMRGIFRVITGDFGHVRIDFCQPFSLKEFIGAQPTQSHRLSMENSQSEESATSPVTSEDTTLDFSTEGMRSRHGSYSSLLGSDVVDSDQKEIVQNLAQHIVYGAAQSTALMSTNLVAFLLLTKHRQGVSMTTLVDSFIWLKTELTVKKRDVGFTGNDEDVVNHALYLLGEDLAMTSVDKNGNTIIEPNLTVPHVFELSYYSNAVISVFLKESIVVNAMFSCMDSQVFLNSDLPEADNALSRETILDMAMELTELFSNEFLFAPTCEELRQVLSETVEDLVMSELIGKEETKISGAYTNREVQLAQRYAREVAWDNLDSDESDTDVLPAKQFLIKANIGEPNMLERLRFYQSILGPYIEGYWITALTITKLREQEMPEDDFIRLLQSDSLKKLEKNLLNFPESVSLEILKNAYKTYQEQKLIVTYLVSNLKMVELRDHFTVEEKLHCRLDLLESLRV